MAAHEAGTRRWMLMIVVAGLLALVAWRVISLGMADHHSRNQPAEALGWRADHPLALLKLSEELAATPGKQAEARETAFRAARANPLDGRPYRVVGELESAAGNEPRAAAYFRKAWQLSPRDGNTNLWLESYYLRNGQPADALRHVDILLRMEPEHAWRQYELVRALAAFPPAHDALAQALSRRPPWRAGVMARLCPTPEAGTGAVAGLVQRLRKSAAGLSDEERHAWLACLGSHGKWGEAYLTWVSALPADQQMQLSNVFNGGFERPPSGAVFDWTLTPAAGAVAAFEATAGAAGTKALHIAFDGRETTFENVAQALVLGPGPYRFQVNSRVEGLDSKVGLAWRLRCSGGNAPLGQTDGLKGTRSWYPIGFDFVVPAQGCEGQMLQLVLPARTRSESVIAGNGWFDDARVTRRP